MFFIQTVRGWLDERSRRIFRYHIGGTPRRGDPVVLGRALEQECPEYPALLSTLAERVSDIPPGPIRQSMVEQQKAAAIKLIGTARKVFQLAPLQVEGSGGVTDAEALSILTKYFRFMTELAEEAKLFQTWPGRESPSRPE